MRNPLNSTEARNEIAKLRTDLERHNRLYYIDDAPELTDREFDLMLRRLTDLEKQFPEFIDLNSPTQRVGGEPIDGFKTVSHAVPMMSLGNKFTEAEVLDYAAKHEGPFVLEPKIDGISISVRYENGQFVQALTRGDGERGDDVSSNLKTIGSLPLRLQTNTPPAVFEVRGEVYMTRSGFAALNEQRQEAGLEPFANPRNACAGSMKLLDPREVAKRPLDIVFYATGQLDGIEFETHSELLNTLKTFGFKTAPFAPTCSTGSELWKNIEQLDAMREEFEYEIDGAVIKIDDRTRYAELGGTAKFPHWATAYKYAPEQAETTLKEITIQIGRTGVLTPVAELEPVQLAGTVVKRATLHNEDEIQRKDIRVGDRVIVEKAGEIIPVVVRVVTEKRSGDEIEFKMPASCPECGEPVEKHESEVAWRCVNLQCPAQLRTWVKHFASRGALDIESIGGVVADKVVDTGMISSPLDLFELKERELAKLNLGTTKDPRTFGPKNAAKVFQGLEKAKTKPLKNWLFALGIPKLGKISADIIAKNHDTLFAIKESKLIADVILLNQKLDEFEQTNPGSHDNRKKQESEKRLLAVEHHHLQKEIILLGTPLEKEGWYKKKNKTFKTKEDQVLFVKTDNGIGIETAKAIQIFFNSVAGMDILNKLAELGITPSKEETGERFSGMTFVITGTLPSLNRDDASEIITKNGGKVSGSVSKNTTYLLAGENAGSKRAKAESLNVKILSEPELLELIGENNPAEEKPPSGQQDWGF